MVITCGFITGCCLGLEFFTDDDDYFITSIDLLIFRVMFIKVPE